jgi:membrane protein implicated in regulation of membrane protease activity
MDGFFAAHNLFSLPQTWLLLAALFAAIEIFAIPAIGFIFAALGALVTALCLQFGWIDATPAMAFSAFFATTVASGLLLWRWLKNLYQGRGNYSDVIGTTAEVCEAPLTKGKRGTVRWSGTTMRAMLAEDAPVTEVAVGSTVTVIAANGTTLTVKP